MFLPCSFLCGLDAGSWILLWSTSKQQGTSHTGFQTNKRNPETQEGSPSMLAAKRPLARRTPQGLSGPVSSSFPSARRCRMSLGLEAFPPCSTFVSPLLLLRSGRLHPSRDGSCGQTAALLACPGAYPAQTPQKHACGMQSASCAVRRATFGLAPELSTAERGL